MLKERKGAYPIILKKSNSGYYVEIPDFESGTQGTTIAKISDILQELPIKNNENRL